MAVKEMNKKGKQQTKERKMRKPIISEDTLHDSHPTGC